MGMVAINVALILVVGALVATSRKDSRDHI
jgi:hypothetical protein